MNHGIRKCEPVYLWAVTAPSHPSFGADHSHQRSNRPNGQMVPRLAVWTVGAIVTAGRIPIQTGFRWALDVVSSLFGC